MNNRTKSLKKVVLPLAILLIVAVGRQYLESPTGTDPEQSTGSSQNSGNLTIEDAVQRKLSGRMLQADGTVSRSLPDDDEGSRHQRFILKLASGHTVLVAHNIDLAKRVPLGPGDKITVYGQFEWNDKGGVLHWTHHDPSNRHEWGWIDHRGQRYQ